MRYLNALETTIQSHGRNHFLHLKQEMVWKYPGAEMEFIQLDNGTNLTQTGKFKKWREGTVSGFPDVTILLSWKGQQKIIFVEFKRIGVPSSVKISDNQKAWNQKLQAMGFQAHIMNNPIYFEKKICGEIRKFFASAYDTGVTPENIVISEILRNLERIGGASRVKK